MCVGAVPPPIRLLCSGVTRFNAPLDRQTHLAVQTILQYRRIPPGAMWCKVVTDFAFKGLTAGGTQGSVMLATGGLQ